MSPLLQRWETTPISGGSGLCGTRRSFLRPHRGFTAFRTSSGPPFTTGATATATAAATTTTTTTIGTLALLVGIDGLIDRRQGNFEFVQLIPLGFGPAAIGNRKQFLESSTR